MMSSRKRAHVPKPLRRFDFELVLEPLEGVLVNVDRDLQRMVQKAERSNDIPSARRLVLLDIMARFATNSFSAVRFIAGDIPEDPRRKFNYVLVVPAINRQLLDLLFSIVYMLDDFEPRSLQYQRAGWREIYEEYQQFKTQFSGNPEWGPHFRNVRKVAENLATAGGITAAECKDPKSVPYWKHPFELKDELTRSRSFLRYLDKWLYGDTSAQSHLSFGGLFMVMPFLLADLVGGQEKELVESRTRHQYRYQHVCRTTFVTLAIASEIDAFCKLGNSERIVYLWNIIAEYSPEAKEMLEHRYADLWN